MSISKNKSDQLQLGQIPTPVKPVLPKLFLTPLQRLFLSDNQPSLDSSTENNDDVVDKGGKNKEDIESGSASSKKGSDRSRSRDKVASKRTDFVDTQEQKFRYYNKKSKFSEKKVSVESAHLNNIASQKKSVEQVVSVAQNKPFSVLQALPTKDARQNYLQIKQAFSGLFQDDHQVSKPVSSNPSHDRFYKTKFCPQFKQGHCQRGEKCSFAHGESQLREIVGVLYKTKICYSNERGSCLKGDKCGFAHGKEEIRESKQTEDSSKTREKPTQKRRQENCALRNNNQLGSQQRQAGNHKTRKIDYNQHYSVNFNQSNFDKQVPSNMAHYLPYYGGHYYPPNGIYMQPPQVSQQAQGFSSMQEGYPNYFFPYYPYYQPHASGSLYHPFPNFAQNGPGQRSIDPSPSNLPGGINDAQGRLHFQRRESEIKRGCQGPPSEKLLKN